MSKKLKIDIVSDVVCPWCIVGYKRLAQAIAELGVEDKVELTWQPFELNPNMPEEGQDLYEHINEKYGSSVEQSNASREQLKQHGASIDFKFDFFEGMRIVNTRDAHVLLNYAKGFGKQTALNIRLVTAYFSEHKDISKRDILRSELLAFGLNADDALALLDGSDARIQIAEEEKQWKNMGVSAVPTIVFNRESALTGAQSVVAYKQVLTDLLK